MSTRFDSIDIPEEILDAQESGTLVIFAGAGISRDDPTGLPDFPGLVKKVGEGSKLPYDGRTEPDQYLGELKKQGVDVHGEVRRILTQGNLEQNVYHTLLPHLFPSKDNLKIVTTNLDELLLKSTQRKDVPVYEAPALPVGDDFEGLVFLHGSVRQESRRMVLTDADFSRAYLTEGWARRFLLKLFKKYTVLFIGYSHDDTVISYLARGLPVGGKKRFVFTCDKQKAEHWSHLGVKPIGYEEPDNEGPHENLIIGLRKWVEVTAMGSLEHRSRVITLAEAAPPIDEHEKDYLKRRFRDVSLVKTFVKHAKDPKWLSWIAERKFLAPLFALEEIKDDQQRKKASAWADWLAELGVGKGHVEALKILIEKNVVWNRILWFAVAKALHSPKDIPHDQFNHWVYALLTAPLPSGGTFDYLGDALRKCKAVERASTALLLFDRMTRPTPKRRERITLHEKEEWEHVRWEVSFPENDYWIREIWNKLFTPELGRFVDRILPIAEANLRLAYEITQPASGDFDSLNFRRYHIANSKDDGHLDYNGVVDVLIDAVRDCLRDLIRNRPSEGVAVARRYLRSVRALFQRLAFDALLTVDNSALSDDLLTWILDADLIKPNTESSELSQLLKRIYPRASQETRISILERIKKQYAVSAEEDNDKGRFVQQARLAMLRYLAEAAPDCEETARHWNEAKKGIPEDHLPSWVPGEGKEPKAGWLVPISPYTKEKLLEADPVSVIDTFDKLEPDDFFNLKPDKSGLESQIREATTADASYGLRMAEALTKLSQADHPLWGTIFEGWRATFILEAEGESLIECLENNFEALAHHHSQAADFMKAAVENEDRRPPFTLLPRLEQLADKLWGRIKDTEGQCLTDDVDWVSDAITSTAGTLTQFWLHALSWRRKESGSAWRGLPDNYRSIFGQIVDSNTYGAQMGQVILAGQLHFLSYLDEAWTYERMAPLFAFDSDEDRAYRVWSGFSLQGRMSPAVVDMLRPHFQDIFKNLTKFSDDERRGIVQRIAAMIHYEGADWWRDGLLAEFIAVAEENDLVEFTETLGRFWEANDEVKRKEAWDAWIDEYIQNRSSGKPVSFSNQETGALATWVFSFAFMAERFVKVITSLPKPVLHTDIFYRLEESDLPEKKPRAVLDLIAWLLSGAERDKFWEGDEVLKIARQLSNSGIASADLEAAIGNQCVELGLDEVIKLFDDHKKN